MNLEELKILWNSQEPTITEDRVSRDEVLALLEGKGRNALSRINRNILIEMGVVALFGVLWILMLVSKAEPPSTLEIVGIFSYVTLSAVFYRWKFTSLNSAQLEGKNLKTALQHTVKVMGRFMKIYHLAGWILVPILGTASFLYGRFIEPGLNPALLSTEQLAVIIGVLLVYNIMAVVSIRWYVRKLYGQHHEVLKGALEELEETE